MRTARRAEGSPQVLASADASEARIAGIGGIVELATYPMAKILLTKLHDPIGIAGRMIWA